MFPFEPSRGQPASRCRPRSTKLKEIEDSRTFLILVDRYRWLDQSSFAPLFLFAYFRFSSRFSSQKMGAMRNIFTVSSTGGFQARGPKSPVYSDILMQCRLPRSWPQGPQSRTPAHPVRTFPPRASIPSPRSRRCGAGDGWKDRPRRSHPATAGDPAYRNPRRTRPMQCRHR